jgi:hypothetical protein
MKPIHAFGWVTVIQWLQQLGSSLQRGPLVGASVGWGPFFDGLCSFAQENLWMGFI